MASTSAVNQFNRRRAGIEAWPVAACQRHERPRDRVGDARGQARRKRFHGELQTVSYWGHWVRRTGGYPLPLPPALSGFARRDGPLQPLGAAIRNTRCPGHGARAHPSGARASLSKTPARSWCRRVGSIPARGRRLAPCARASVTGALLLAPRRRRCVGWRAHVPRCCRHRTHHQSWLGLSSVITAPIQNRYH